MYMSSAIYPEEKNGKFLKTKVRKLLHDNFHLEHVTLELEISSEDCGYIDCVS